MLGFDIAVLVVCFACDACVGCLVLMGGCGYWLLATFGFLIVLLVAGCYPVGMIVFVMF